MDVKKWATATESLVKLAEINFTNAHSVKCKSTHHAWLYSYKQCEFTDIDMRSLQLFNAIYFTVPACVFISVGEIMAGRSHFALLIYKNTPHRNLLLLACYKCLLQGQIHKMSNLCLTKVLALLYHKRIGKNKWKWLFFYTLSHQNKVATKSNPVQ